MTELDRNGDFGEPTGPQEVPQAMLEDALLLSGVDEATIRHIAERLVSSAGMLSPQRIVEIVNQHLNGGEAEAVSRIVANITPAETPKLLRLLEGWSRLRPGDPRAPSDAAIRQISSNLNLLVQDHPALQLMRKAQRLLREIGNELQSAVFVCDIRPVFDDAHTEVVGFVRLVNMQLGYTRQDGDLEFFEATLTGDELRYILDRGRDALSKLEILDTMLRIPLETDENQ